MKRLIWVLIVGLAIGMVIGCSHPLKTEEPVTKETLSISDAMNQMGYKLVSNEELNRMVLRSSGPILPRQPDRIDIGQKWHYVEIAFADIGFSKAMLILQGKEFYPDISGKEKTSFWIVEAALLGYLKTLLFPPLPEDTKGIPYIEILTPKEREELELVLSDIEKTTKIKTVRDRAKELLSLLKEYNSKEENKDK